MKIDRSRITDDRGRHIPVTRVAPRGPDELAARSRRRRNEAEVETAQPVLRVAADVKRKLDELASRVRRLSPPMASDPERFHVERSEIARELQRLREHLA